jgi:hypothetical protein
MERQSSDFDKALKNRLLQFSRHVMNREWHANSADVSASAEISAAMVELSS